MYILCGKGGGDSVLFARYTGGDSVLVNKKEWGDYVRGGFCPDSKLYRWIHNCMLRGGKKQPVSLHEINANVDDS